MEEAIRILYIGTSQESIALLRSNQKFMVVVHGNRLSVENYLSSGFIPDAILCEMKFTGGDGVEMHTWIRQQEPLKHVSFILLLHEFREDQYKDAFNRHIDDFFVLPLVNPEQMAGRILYLKSFRKRVRHEEPKLNTEVVYHMPWTKRVFDVVMASGALIVLSPLLLLVILAIRLESKGKVYYISRRVGRVPFDFYKLRSMRTGADKELASLAKDKNQYAAAVARTGIDFELPCPKCAALPHGHTCSTLIHIGSYSICEYWFQVQKKEIEQSRSAFIKIQNDPRVTRVGKIIRNTSIDELPQLINVLKGDMSIVGNRPLPVYEAELLTRDDMARRFLAPAGITGLWQVELRGRGGDMSEDERKRLDNVYSDHFIGNNYSFWYDFKLILRTFKALFQKDSV
jgi:lipopolysaccharide/colanic/teichoic acid biosynthesis glycosyltransferase